MPLDILQELVKQHREEQEEHWDQMRWLVATVRSMLGDKVSPQDLIKLSKDERINQRQEERKEVNKQRIKAVIDGQRKA
jgi:hypothetical protein